MSDEQMRFACQTYSWQMSLERYRGRLPHIAGVASRAGFTGLEPETIVLGRGWSADLLKRDLDVARIRLAALCLVGQWTHAHETSNERRDADAVIEALRYFPDTIINLVVSPGADRSHLRERQDSALSCMRDIAHRAAARGIECSFHPNSPAGSVFRVIDDYHYLLDNLDPTIGFTPDVGHIAVGGMDPVQLISQTIDRVRHVHIKDVADDGSWAPTGLGRIDIPTVIRTLDHGGYRGWVAFEDESAAAMADPDAATLAAGKYVRTVLEPIIRKEETS